MINEEDEEKKKLNSSELHINRGVELLLRNRRKREDLPKLFQLKFGKMISLCHREFHLYFDFHIDTVKK